VDFNVNVAMAGEGAKLPANSKSGLAATASNAANQVKSYFSNTTQSQVRVSYHLILKQYFCTASQIILILQFSFNHVPQNKPRQH
jgi:hypothetical protein